MFELPEYMHLAGQIGRTVSGRTIREGTLGNSPHKFVWYNREPEEFAELVRGRVVGSARVRGRFLMVDLEPGYVLTLGECGGRILFNEPGRGWPAKYHLSLAFTDGSSLTVTTRMWGFDQGWLKSFDELDEEARMRGMLGYEDKRRKYDA